jgi:hypothetical protein
MQKIDFPAWREVLTQAELPGRLKRSFEITIGWYLIFCKSGRADVTVQSARDFIAWAAQEKHSQTPRATPGWLLRLLLHQIRSQFAYVSARR